LFVCVVLGEVEICDVFLLWLTMVVAGIVWKFLFGTCVCTSRLVQIVVGCVVRFAERKVRIFCVLEKCARQEKFGTKLKKRHCDKYVWTS
jgi:hypothetical protein